ncbi:MAG: DUF1934 domain-containing protein [Clostridia bacterium]|nr:DUF1934 domain-containing protein [Clostridia bacterium]
MEFKKVKIGISAKQHEGDVSFDSEPMVMNILCEALLADSGDEFSIEYDERVSEDGDVTHTKLVFGKENPGKVSMVRTGEINMSCTFFAGGRCNCNYAMQGGISLDFCMVTKTLKNTVSLGGGTLAMTYNMEVRGVTMSRNEYRLTVIKR